PARCKTIAKACRCDIGATEAVLPAAAATATASPTGGAAAGRPTTTASRRAARLRGCRCQRRNAAEASGQGAAHRLWRAVATAAVIPGRLVIALLGIDQAAGQCRAEARAPLVLDTQGHGEGQMAFVQGDAHRRRIARQRQNV